MGGRYVYMVRAAAVFEPPKQQNQAPSSQTPYATVPSTPEYTSASVSPLPQEQTRNHAHTQTALLPPSPHLQGEEPQKPHVDHPT